MTQFDSLLQNVSELTYEVSLGCYSLELESPLKKELFCAKAIMFALNNSSDILSLLSKVHRHDLTDSIRTHGARYLQEYTKYKELKDDAVAFESCLAEVLEKLSIADKSKIELENTQTEVLSKRFYKVLRKIQMFFANQSQNKDSIEFVHASSIVYRIKNVDFEEQSSLIDLLMLVKELWNTKYKVTKTGKLSISERFYLNPNDVLQINVSEFDAEAIFNVIVCALVSSEDSILLHLQNAQLLSLYDRFRNYEGSPATVFKLLTNIHIEAQFRYSYSRLSDTGYQLLSRFQSFDAINHQIDNLEFNILEAYLFKKSNFTREILVNIAKHVDNIRALSLNKDETLHKIFNNITKKLSNQSKGADGSTAMLSGLKNNLSKMLPSNVKKRYSELDKFANGVLQKKYSNLFANIISIFEDTKDAKKFLQHILTQRLASDYYFPHLSNSIDKLRLQVLDRKQVVSLLSELNFLDIFSPGNFNNITSFNFRKIHNSNELKTPFEYVKLLIEDVCLCVNAFQLESLYKSVAYKDVPTETQTILINSIKIQIKQRMTVRKLLYSIISGQKKEYDKLKLLKKISTESLVTINS